MAGMETTFSNLRKVESGTGWGESSSAKRQSGEGAGIRQPHTVTKPLDQKPITI
jgi:hypothetical protein